MSNNQPRKFRSTFTGKDIEERLNKVGYSVDIRQDLIHDYKGSVSKAKVPSMAAISTFKDYLDEQMRIITGGGSSVATFTQELKDMVERSNGYFQGVYATKELRDAAIPSDVWINFVGKEVSVILDVSGRVEFQHWDIESLKWVAVISFDPNPPKQELNQDTITTVKTFKSDEYKSARYFIVCNNGENTHSMEVITIGNKDYGVLSTSADVTVYGEIFSDESLISSVTATLESGELLLKVATTSIANVSVKEIIRM